MNRAPGVLLRAGLLALAAVAMSVAPRGLPAPPDVVLLVVSATALMRGPWAGALMGLAGGWMLDVVPPGGDPLGAGALSYLAAGAMVGAARRYLAASPLAVPVLPLLTIGAASALVLSIRGVSAAAGFGQAGFAELGWTFVMTVVAALVLTPLLVGVERWLAVHRWG